MINVAAVGRNTLSRYTAALEYRDFRTMWLANMAAQAAAWALIVGRGWLVFDKTHSSAWVGVATFAAMGPMFFVPPIAGVLADRIDRRTILSWTYAINLVSNLLLAVLALFGVLTLWQIIALSLVNGVTRATQLPTSQALAANLVPRHRLLNALSLTAATMHASRLIGPGLVTPLLVFVGAPAAFFMCAVLYAIGWFQIRRIQAPSVGGANRNESFIQNFAGGLSYTFHQPIIRAVLVMVFFHCALTMAFESTMPGFVHQRLTDHLDGGFGILLSGVGLGGLIGSIYIGGVESAVTRGRLMLAMGILSGFGQVALSFTSAIVPAFISAALMGGAQAAFMTMGQAITQSLAEDEYRGRLASINTFSLGGIMAIMNLTNGFISANYGSDTVLRITGVLFVVVMLLSVLAFTPRRVYLRGIPAEVGAA